MKRLVCLCTLLTTFLLLSMSCFAANTKESSNIKVVIDGKQCTFENVPITSNNRTLLPMVAILTNLGVKNDKQHIIWNGKEGSITIYKDNKKIYLKINNVNAFIDNVPAKIDVAPVTYKGRTYIPASFVAQALGRGVAWDKNTSTVLIYDESNYNQAKEIMDKCNSNMKDLVKYKNSNHIKIDMESIGDYISDSIFEIDTKNKIIHETDNEDKFGEKSDSETYTIQKVQYSRNSSDGKWEKGMLTDQEYTDKFSPDSTFANIELQGLTVKDNPNEKQIIIEGDVLPNEMSAEWEDYGMKDDATLIAHLKIILDKQTYLCKEMDVNAKGLFPSEDSKMQYDITCNLKFYDFDGNYEIVLPKDLQ